MFILDLVKIKNADNHDGIRKLLRNLGRYLKEDIVVWF